MRQAEATIYWCEECGDMHVNVRCPACNHLDRYLPGLGETTCDECGERFEAIEDSATAEWRAEYEALTYKDHANQRADHPDP